MRSVVGGEERDHRGGRLGSVEDIAAAVIYLASPASSWVTGKIFEVDGGTVASNWPTKIKGFYGLVFASYARKALEPDHKEEFFAKVLKDATALSLRYHDLEKPYFRSAYEDYPITVLGEKWRVTLRAGLWRPRA